MLCHHSSVQDYCYVQLHILFCKTQFIQHNKPFSKPNNRPSVKLMEKEAASSSLEYTPTWIVAGVCGVMVLISLFAARGLHKLGKWLKRQNQLALYESLEKLKEELMLLGFISLLLTVFQGVISRTCISSSLTDQMLPCKRSSKSEMNGNEHIVHQSVQMRRQLLSTESNVEHCAEGKTPIMSIEALHQLHIFIFVLALVHVVFCVTTMLLGGAKIREWKSWENSIKEEKLEKTRSDTFYPASSRTYHDETRRHHEIFKGRAAGYWRKSKLGSWSVMDAHPLTVGEFYSYFKNYVDVMIAFFKQFYNSVTKSDYIALRHGFIMAHCPHIPSLNFYKYTIRTLEIDFKMVVSINWYLWVFIILFLLWNIGGWHTYFWLSFLPLVMLLLVGAKLEHIITCLAQEIVDEKGAGHQQVKPSDGHFWFHRPKIVLHLIQFILFQNSFEMAFFFWIWSTYGIHSCIMEKIGYIIPRLIIGVAVQVLCSYSTLPLYALVTQMGSRFKEGIFTGLVREALRKWAENAKTKRKRHTRDLPEETEKHMDQMAIELHQNICTLEHREDINDAAIDVNEDYRAV